MYKASVQTAGVEQNRNAYRRACEFRQVPCSSARRLRSVACSRLKTDTLGAQKRPGIQSHTCDLTNVFVPLIHYRAFPFERFLRNRAHMNDVRIRNPSATYLFFPQFRFQFPTLRLQSLDLALKTPILILRILDKRLVLRSKLKTKERHENKPKKRIRALPAAIGYPEIQSPSSVRPSMLSTCRLAT